MNRLPDILSRPLRHVSWSAPKVGLTARQRLELRVVRALCGLPSGLQVRLSGRPPVRVDGQTLEPEVQLGISLLERRGAPPIESLSLDEAREAYRRSVGVSNGVSVPVGSVRDLEVDGADGPLAARLYSPAEIGGPCPLIVFFHGGGFVLGDLDTHDAPCRLLCKHSGARVLSVNYRLAPEHPFPAPVEDGRAALGWAIANAEELGADPNRVAVAGDSAGGSVAAVATWLASRDGGPMPALQVLIYPATEAETGSRSRDLFGGGFLLTRELMAWFQERYVAGADTSDPRLSFTHAEGLGGIPPTFVVTAGFDPLRDEAEEYAEALRAAGVSSVTVRRFPGLVHGFCNAIGTSRVSREALIEVAGTTRGLLAMLA